MNRNLNDIETEGQKGELSHPVTMAEPNKEKDSLFLLARAQPRERPSQLSQRMAVCLL